MNRRKITTLDGPQKNKELDMDTKKMIQYVSLSVDLTKAKRHRCWWCTLYLDKEPIGCPINITYTNGVKKYSVEGIFCSFNCVKAYINEKEQNNMMYKRGHELLGHMVCDMNGCISPVSIDPAPDKYLTLLQ